MSELSSPVPPPLAPPSDQGSRQSAGAVAPSTITTSQLLGRMGYHLARRALAAGLRLATFARERAGMLVVIAILLLVIVIETIALVAPRLSALGSSSASPPAATMLPAAAVEQFIRGQQEYDIELVWSALSSDLQATLELNGATREAIAAQLEREREAGQRYRSVQYIGGVDLDNGRQMFFYAIDIESALNNRDGIASFVFTVDREGKIISLRM